MPLLQLAAECEIFFKNNWTNTPLEIPETPFDYDGVETYISITFNPTINQRIGSDRVLYHGLSSIFCYHKSKKLALKLADEVAEFFKCKELPHDIHTDIAQYGSPTDLDNSYWEVKVNFEVKQY